VQNAGPPRHEPCIFAGCSGIGGPPRGLGAAPTFEPESTMPLTPEDVSRIAHLARLELSSAEADAMLGQLNGFFRIVEQMSAVDTRGVEPLYTPLSAVQSVALRLREDEVTEGNEREANQASAPALENGLYLVPKVIE
jgi:aspartyl-tRNA(Asn)/glutamyl-tRNA(Gln) amidotransferase subunit C